jgi:transglutaminase-like putative cysteine protease
MYRNPLAVCLVAALAGVGPPATPVSAQSTDSRTPSSTKSWHEPNVTAVVRLDDRRLEVESPGKARFFHTFVADILRPEGRNLGELILMYDRLKKLKRLEGWIRDDDGTVIRKLDNDDIEDYSAVSGYSLYDENRMRIANLKHNQFPFTVEYRYEYEYNGVIQWPSWRPAMPDVPVELAKFEIVTPRDLEVRYASSTGIVSPNVAHTDETTTYTWTERELPPFRREAWGPSAARQIPAVIIAPSEFEVEGYPGRMDTWGSFGSWYANLSQGKGELPGVVQQEIRALTAGAANVADRARIVYDYVQRRVRYVSVQLGIGGWMPEPATVVHDVGYGDCKALTNYTMSLLRFSGIEAYPALIQLGEDGVPVREDFPCNLFNHVILYVPTDGDAIWLECTSQTYPFGHLNSGTEDRLALVVRNGRGELRRTPASRPDDNTITRRADVVLRADGTATVSMSQSFTGSEADPYREVSWNGEIEKTLLDLLDIQTFDVDTVTISHEGVSADPFRLEATVRVLRLGTASGTRLFVPANILDPWESVPPAMNDRTQPVVLPYRFHNADSVTFSLPGGYDVEALTQPVEIITDFGMYRSESVQVDSATVAYRRIFRIEETEIPATEYPRVIDFFEGVARADGRQFVLRRR